MRARERSEACLWLPLLVPGKQEQLAALAPSSGAARHLLPQAGEGLGIDSPQPNLSPRQGRAGGPRTFRSSPSRVCRRRDGPGSAAKWKKSLSPVYGRRAGDRLPKAQPFTEAGKGWGTADLPEQPFSRLREKGWSRQRRKVEEKPFSRLREKVPGGRMRARERSEACFWLPLLVPEEQEQLAALAPSSGAARHLLPLRRRRDGPAGAAGHDGRQPFSGGATADGMARRAETT
jgi:hypothetical protein